MTGTAAAAEGIFRKALNDEQYAAVTAPDGPVFVLAAAGTGKTRTLVYRVAYLVEKGIDPSRILLLTFTNRAAREMLERAERAAGRAVSGLWGGTFHHMANRILRRYAPLLGFKPDYTILDRDDSVSLIREIISKLKLKDKRFPKAEVLMSFHSAAANGGAALRDYIQARLDGAAVDIEDVLRVYSGYADRKADLGAMDFDDLLLNGLRLFKEHGEVLRRFQEQFLHVLVDEYQDTNPIQAEWIDLIAAGHGNLLVVGDDFQSIYSWRGADYRNILSFPERYPDAALFKIETNYRSTPEILQIANRCIAGNPGQFQKTLRAVRPSGARPALAVLRDGEHQARYVVEQIGNLRRSGVALKDIAVLYRAHFHAMDLQLALVRERLPHVVTSGVRFFEQAHIKDACSLLRLLNNPSDEIAFARFLQLFPGIGPRTAARIWAKLNGRVELDTPARRKLLFDCLPPALQAEWPPIQDIMAAYHDQNLSEDPGEAIHLFLEAFYAGHLAEQYDEPQHRMDDIQELILFTSDFESNADFLGEMALISNLDAEAETLARESKDSVRLSTVHQAKGLEWKAVFVLWLGDGLFPSSRSISEQGNDSEERRLFYVAVTRACDRLFLCAPQVRRAADGSCNFLAPSRFLTELPQDLMRTERIPYL